MQKKKKQKLIIVIGPTASGKTAKAISLAKKVGGEVISADSRQIYKGLDVGTAKVTKREMQGVPHHCLDIASPKRAFSVAQWKKCAEKAIKDITKCGSMPIVAGGTGLYIDALLDLTQLPEVPPNKKLRAQLEKKTPAQLFAQLKKLDTVRAQDIGEKNEFNNKRRLIRAIEIAKALGKVPRLEVKELPYEVTWISMNVSDKILAKRIENRLDARIRQGLIAEVKRLREQGVSWKRLHELGLEYRAVAQFLRGEQTKQEMRDELLRNIIRYAKRQKRWLKRYEKHTK